MIGGQRGVERDGRINIQHITDHGVDGLAKRGIQLSQQVGACPAIHPDSTIAQPADPCREITGTNL